MQRERYYADRADPAKVERMRISARDQRAQRREERAAREDYREAHPYVRGAGRKKQTPDHGITEVWADRESRWCPSPNVAESDWMMPITRAQLMAGK